MEVCKHACVCTHCDRWCNHQAAHLRGSCGRSMVNLTTSAEPLSSLAVRCTTVLVGMLPKCRWSGRSTTCTPASTDHGTQARRVGVCLPRHAPAPVDLTAWRATFHLTQSSDDSLYTVAGPTCVRAELSTTHRPCRLPSQGWRCLS